MRGRGVLIGDRTRGRRPFSLCNLLAQPLHRHVLPLDPLDRERQTATLFVDLEDLHVEAGAGLDHFARVLDVVVGKLGDVDQALDAGEDFDEGAISLSELRRRQDQLPLEQELVFYCA